MSSSHEETASKTLFGFWTFIMSDFVFFSALFSTYAVLSPNTAGGPSGAQIFNLQHALIQTLLLLASSFAAGPAVLAAYQKKPALAVLWLLISLLLGIFFFVLEIGDFSRLIHEGHGWERSAFLSAFFNLVATHGLHVLIGLLWMVVLIVLIIRRGITPVLLRRITCLRLFWHFVNIVWIFIFTFVYLLGAAHA